MRITGTAHRILRRVCAICVALALVFVCAEAFFPAMAESDGMIRVRLTRLGAPTEITLAVDCDYYLAADPTVRVGSGDTVTFTAGANGLAMVVGSKKVALGDTAKLMRAQSGNRGIRFMQPELSNRFCGDLGLSASGGVISAILNIYVENYLYGVVGYAMPPSADIEALKAQAVASRTSPTPPPTRSSRATTAPRTTPRWCAPWTRPAAAWYITTTRWPSASPASPTAGRPSPPATPGGRASATPRCGTIPTTSRAPPPRSRPPPSART